MTAIALVVALALLAALAVMQILAASGLPLGHFGWGGQHRVLPRGLRVASTVSVLVYAGLAAEDYSNALIEINKYIKIDDSFPFLIYKHSLLADLGHFEVSLKGFERISKIKHDNVKVFNIYYLYYGHALEVMGKYEEAIKIYDKYLDNYNFLKEDIQEAKDNLLEEVF